MVKGIGIDAVAIKDIAELLECTTKGVVSRFAVKEAAFKAIAPRLPDKGFDYRRIETRNHEDGSPYIYVDEFLSTILNRAEITTLFVSITTAGDMATAFVVAES